MSRQGWIGVDLDGTLAEYDGWHGLEHIGKPIGPMVDRIRAWLKAGVEVRIFTARVADAKERYAATYHIHMWLSTQANLPKLKVTNVKDFQMVELWDDRAVQVIPNTGCRADGQ